MVQGLIIQFETVFYVHNNHRIFELLHIEINIKDSNFCGCILMKMNVMESKIEAVD